MRPATLALLGAATLVLLLMAWALQREPAGPETGELLLPGLATQLNAVSAIELEPAGGEAFRIERGGDGWRAPAKGGYPVDTARVRELLLGLAETRVAETKTANPDLHDRLGVEMAGDRPGSGMRLALEGLAAPVQLVLGQRETRGLSGTYVRRLDEPAALLVDRDLQVEREPLGWLERAVLDIPPEEVESLHIERPDGTMLQVDRDELGIFRIANLPPGREPSGPTAAEALARALTALRLDDVRPRGDEDPPGTPIRAQFRLHGGIVIEAMSWESLSPAGGADYWTAFAARSVDERAAAEAEALGQRLSPWLYRLPAWQHERLARRLEDLLQPAGP